MFSNQQPVRNLSIKQQNTIKILKLPQRFRWHIIHGCLFLHAVYPTGPMHKALHIIGVALKEALFVGKDV